MTRRMSCSLTLDAVRERSKTVTRRHVDTWSTLRPGERLTLIEKGMGLPKGTKQVIVDVVTVVDVRVEPLHLVADTDYGWAEVAREGFPDMGPSEFVEFWLDSHGVNPRNFDEFMAIEVRRIEWVYGEGESTAIGWTDHTFNPWWGCERVSPGCQHCYAETFARRTGHDVWGRSADRRFFGDKHWAEPLKWDRAAAAAGAPALVFCSSMADVFEDRPELVEHRERLWELIEATPHLIWQLLTKRPQNVLPMTRFRYFHGLPDNVWVGTTVEDQQRADERIPHLLEVPARIRFLSCEPLLGPVHLPWLSLGITLIDDPAGTPAFRFTGNTIDWVIVGGESGPGHRPLNLDHARALVDQCETAGVAVFFKQIGGRTPAAGGDRLAGRTIKEFPMAWHLRRGPQ